MRDMAHPKRPRWEEVFDDLLFLFIFVAVLVALCSVPPEAYTR
jgi:hypothetical protein